MDDEEWPEEEFDNEEDWDVQVDDIEQSDQEEGWEIKVDNLFYEGEGDKKDNPQNALAKFLECISLEETESPNHVVKRFLALKFVVILQFQLHLTKEMGLNYHKLLSLAQHVTPNELNNAVTSILNVVEDSSDPVALTSIYSTTLEYFKKTGKDRMWFEFAMKLCKTHLNVKDYKNCEILLNELHESCRKNGRDDMAKGAQLLEIYSVRIQIVMASDNRVALNEIFDRTKHLIADINDPRSTSIIEECWGKMYASMNKWNDAYQNFFAAFRSYSSIGHTNARQCLKYVVIASMLSKEAANPFASQEAGVYLNNNEISPIANLLEAFDSDDIKKFEKTLAMYSHKITNDDFIKEYMPTVKLKIRSKVLVKLIKPYRRVKLEWLCMQLNATHEEVENLIVNLILDGSIHGRLNQINDILDLDFITESEKLYSSIDNWLNAINRAKNSIIAKAGSDQTHGQGRRHMNIGLGSYGGSMGSMMMDFDIDDDIVGIEDAWM